MTHARTGRVFDGNSHTVIAEVHHLDTEKVWLGLSGYVGKRVQFGSDKRLNGCIIRFAPRKARLEETRKRGGPKFHPTKGQFARMPGCLNGLPWAEAEKLSSKSVRRRRKRWGKLRGCDVDDVALWISLVWWVSVVGIHRLRCHIPDHVVAQCGEKTLESEDLPLVQVGINDRMCIQWRTSKHDALRWRSRLESLQHDPNGLISQEYTVIFTAAAPVLSHLSMTGGRRKGAQDGVESCQRGLENNRNPKILPK